MISYSKIIEGEETMQVKVDPEEIKRVKQEIEALEKEKKKSKLNWRNYKKN